MKPYSKDLRMSRKEVAEVFGFGVSTPRPSSAG